MPKEVENEEKSSEKERLVCPVCQLLNIFSDEGSKAISHFKQAKVEILKGLKELIDVRIRSLEDDTCGTKGKRFSKVKVEDVTE